MKTNPQILKSRLAALVILAVLFLTAMPVGTVSAATSATYNFQVDAGTPVATGVVTDDEVCGKSKLTATTTLMDTGAQSCPLHLVKPSTAGPQNILDVWFNTPYPSAPP